jgi:CBS domain-containing protein
MSPRALSGDIVRDAPVLRADQRVAEAATAVVDSGLPALPVVDADEKLVGIFGEREFIGALFPGWLGEIKSAAFVPDTIDDAIERRLECRQDPVEKYTNTEHVAAGPRHSDVQLAETFLHHRVLLIPVVDEDQHVTGVVTRSDFFAALVQRSRERA